MKYLSRLTIAVGVIVSSLAVTTPTSAQSTTIVTYESVDGYSPTFNDQGTGNLQITGVIQGASSATTDQYALRSNANAQACERMLAMTMLRPGRFTFGIEVSSYSKCFLTRRP